MTSEHAIRIVSRYCPCPHNEYAQPLGLGDLHRCEQCGALFDPSTPEFYAERTMAFDEAVKHLRSALTERAAVVAWLRSQVSQAVSEGDLDLDWAANAIERGVHRKETT
jgi:hypothetical protein